MPQSLIISLTLLKTVAQTRKLDLKMSEVSNRNTTFCTRGFLLLLYYYTHIPIPGRSKSKCLPRKIFNDDKKLENELCHSQVNVLFCNNCPFKTMYKRSIERHMSRLHPESSDKGFTTERNMYFNYYTHFLMQCQTNDHLFISLLKNNYS